MSKPSRKRGVTLTYQGQQKIEQARRLAETQDNFSDRYTYEELSQLTNLSLNTVIKIVGYEVPVDKQSLDCFFSAFNIVLERGDYTQPNNGFVAQRELRGYK